MKLTNRELDNYFRVFQKLSQIEFKGALGYKIYRFITNLADEINKFNEYRMKLERENFEVDENGRLIFDDNGSPVPKENTTIENYINILNEVFDLESDVEVPDIELHEDEIFRISLSATDWAILDRFIKLS